MSTEAAANSKLAVLIDADNVTPTVTDALFAEAAKYGISFVRRAYGDWTGPNLKGWKEQLLRRSIQPIQQFSYTQGKNATDSAMIIDAMDLLYTNRFDGFCLVSSDSDFTRLAARIRESGLVVYGFGERKTPKPFVAACDKFIYFENLHVTPDDDALAASLAVSPQASVSVISSPTHKRAPSSSSSSVVKIDEKLAFQLRMAVEASSDEEGWANLAKVGSLITKQRPDFDPRTYGLLKFNEVVIATNAFEIDKRTPAEGKATVMYARDKKRK
ncbi:NYN domain-containing protein [Chaetomidium leptoderma]|uniref:NYN domain-containing protein n=1 Tax=Chaetomidium leptoderma TaxID=669021 RepID=A0AAN6VGC5_9PEZI|nr:NYN domain-containing protein [Chaetomidium leptoderma]